MGGLENGLKRQWEWVEGHGGQKQHGGACIKRVWRAKLTGRPREDHWHPIHYSLHKPPIPPVTNKHVRKRQHGVIRQVIHHPRILRNLELVQRRALDPQHRNDQHVFSACQALECGFDEVAGVALYGPLRHEDNLFRNSGV